MYKMLLYIAFYKNIMYIIIVKKELKFMKNDKNSRSGLHDMAVARNNIVISGTNSRKSDVHSSGF